MRHLYKTLLIAAFAVTALPALAGDAVLKILDPYIFSTPPRATSAGGYMTIVNDGTAADRLLSVRADIGNAMVHRTVTDAEGVTRMEHQMGGVEIPSGGEVALEPGGLHLMLMGLSAPLKSGTGVDVILVFEAAGEVPVTLPVIDRGDEPGMKMNHGHGTDG